VTPAGSSSAESASAAAFGSSYHEYA
jgi:hypothetical protein